MVNGFIIGSDANLECFQVPAQLNRKMRLIAYSDLCTIIFLLIFIAINEGLAMDPESKASGGLEKEPENKQQDFNEIGAMDPEGKSSEDLGKELENSQLDFTNMKFLGEGSYGTVSSFQWRPLTIFEPLGCVCGR